MRLADRYPMVRRGKARHPRRGTYSWRRRKAAYQRLLHSVDRVFLLAVEIGGHDTLKSFDRCLGRMPEFTEETGLSQGVRQTSRRPTFDRAGHPASRDPTQV